MSETSTLTIDLESNLAHSEPGLLPRGILVVDDEEMIRTMLAAYLQRHELPHWMASGGMEAVRLYREHSEQIGLVLLDVRMPRMDGAETLRLLRAINPAVICYFMSGDHTPYGVEELTALGAAGIVVKPFLLRALGQLVQNCLSQVSS